MPRIFRKKGQHGGALGGGGDDDDDAHHDDAMTIASGWSRGGSSVSDRIMGRMKMNLGGVGAGGGSVVGNDSSSVVSGGSRRSRMSTGKFGGRVRSRSRGKVRTSSSVDGDGSRRSNFLRGHSSRSAYHGGGMSGRGPISSMGPSLAGINAMEEMDSTEAMALKGQTFGRRRAVPAKSGQHRHRRSPKRTAAGWTSENDPAEHSLAELRSMDEFELRDVMRKAGVSEEDISKTLNDAGNGTDPGPISDDQRKNTLVAFFVNSGRVKLVPKGLKNAAKSSKDVVDGADGAERRSKTPEPPTPTKSDGVVEEGRPLVVSVDASSVASSITKRESVTKRGSGGESRKSKLEKIAELKTENSNMKRENKSLKKTVKKLLGQLKRAIDERDKLMKKTSDEGGGVEGSQMKDSNHDASNKSLHSIDEKGKEESRRPTPPFDVVTRDEDEGSASAKSHGNDKPPRQIDDRSWHSIASGSVVTSDKTMAKKVDVLKRKYNKEKEAHMNTEFRLKAEADILAKEVDGLQRELAAALKSSDEAKRRAREAREAASELRHELRVVAGRVDELTAEADARDRLIETFSKILLQKVGLEEEMDGIGGGSDGEANEEKLGDGTMAELKLPRKDT